MNEIRFNQPTPAEAETTPENGAITPKTGGFKKKIIKFLAALLKVVVVLALLYGSIIGSKQLFLSKSIPNQYSAVFLVNGQVYFGKISESDKSQMLLTDVYYLQIPEGAQALSNSHFNLIKLGTELHGPTDELYINQSQIVFYENLRQDSKLVESIRGMK